MKIIQPLEKSFAFLSLSDICDVQTTWMKKSIKDSQYQQPKNNLDFWWPFSASKSHHKTRIFFLTGKLFNIESNNGMRLILRIRESQHHFGTTKSLTFQSCPLGDCLVSPGGLCSGSQQSLKIITSLTSRST